MADRRVVALVLVSVIALTIQSCLLIVTHAHLFADGAFYLYRLLLTGRPLDIDFGRHFAHLATQSPGAFAIALGTTRIDVVSVVLGVGLYAPALVGLGICAWIAGTRVELLLFPLASAVAVTSNSSFFVVSESHLLAAVFWPLMFLFVLSPHWTLVRFLLAAALALPTLRSYESMALLGPLLALCAAYRARRVNGWARVGLAVLAAYCIAGTAVAAYFILNPRVPSNYEAFWDSLRFYQDHLGHWHWLGMVSIGTIALVFVALFVRVTSRWRIALLIVSSLAAFGAALLPIIDPLSVAPLLHYRARVLNAYGPPVLALVFLWSVHSGPVERQWRFAFALVATLAVAQVSWHALAVREWSNYRHVFREEIVTRRGLVPFNESVLSADVMRGRPIAAMNWGWTMPTMSVLLAPGGNVQALIDNPPRKGFQPFRPEDLLRLPDLSAYGVRYDAYRAAIEGR